tara:strand:- start:402 stop:824 length:423 start_codon:yes stop_codon:yes gene_type:complete
MTYKVIYKDKPKEATFKSLIQVFFKEYPDADIATVYIEKGKPKRSTAQNKLYWTWIGIIASELGYTKDEMHIILGDRFLKKIEVVTKKGKEIAQIPSTTQLTVDEFIDYLCEIEMLCDEWDITLPRNDDYQLAVYGNAKV